MSKKLLTEAQVRKFMGLANLDANVSSNFINEMYNEGEEEVEEGLNLGDKYKKTAGKAPEGEDPHDAMRQKDEGMGKYAKHDDEGVHEEMEVEMDAEELEGGDPEAADESEAEVDVELNQDEVEGAKAKLEDAHEALSDLLNKLMGGSAPEMDDPAEEPPMDMGDMDMGMDDEPAEMMEETNTELTEDEIVQEVAKRVAKRINEAAKKADK